MSAKTSGDKLERFDDYLSFVLPDGYEVVRGQNDDGNSTFDILFHAEITDSGEKSAEMKIGVRKQDSITIDDEKRNLNGSIACVLRCTIQEARVAIFTMQVLVAVAVLEKDGHAYAIMANRVARSEDDLQGNADLVANHLNVLLNNLVIDGMQGKFEEITAERLLAGGDEPKDNPFRLAKPGRDQLSQLSFQRETRSRLGMLGGLIQVNSTGTEFSFTSLTDMAEHSENSTVKRILSKAVSLDGGQFALSATAHDMARLFRVNYEVFDAAHDREQEIESGLIQRAETFDGLRSFAWTLSAYCEDQEIEPGELDWPGMQELIAFVAGRKWVNFQADSYCDTLCSGDDIHIFYLPDTVSESDKKTLLKEINNGTEDALSRSSIMSLDGLRRDLTYVFPAIQTIYSALSENRDPNVALLGNEADILYAWCVTAYAAREPVFTDDGPMNCCFGHPDEVKHLQQQWKEQRERVEKEQAEEWLSAHRKHLSKVKTIQVSGKKFVFTGAEAADNWNDIKQHLIDHGGLVRGAVSGQTDYLVCDPRNAGESKIKAVQEQRAKGKKIEIILLEELLPLIGLDCEKQSNNESTKMEDISPEHNPKDRTDNNTSLCQMQNDPIHFTYQQGLKAGSGDYEMDIPDGFIIQQGAENRDFIAWLPASDKSDGYIDSPFIIFAGNPQTGDIYSQVKTVYEYEALARMAAVGTELSGLFEGHTYLPYLRSSLPGGIAVAYDSDVIHVNAYFGMGDYMKPMRLQISVPSKKDRVAYNNVITGIFDHMRANSPVKLLPEMNDSSFVDSINSMKFAKEWDECADEWVKHILISRALKQRLYVNSFQAKQGRGRVNPSDLKKDIKKTLVETTELFEMQLTKAEAIYRETAERNPDNKALPSMRKSIKKLAEAADQTVTLDGQEIKNRSSLAKDVVARLDRPQSEKKNATSKKEKKEAVAPAQKEINNSGIELTTISEQQISDDFGPCNVENRIYTEKGTCEIVRLAAGIYMLMPGGMTYSFQTYTPNRILEAEDKSTGRWLMLSHADCEEPDSERFNSKKRRKDYLNAIMQMPIYEAAEEAEFFFDRSGYAVSYWKSAHFADAWYLCVVYRNQAFLCQYSCSNPTMSQSDLKWMAESIRVQSAEKTKEQVYHSWLAQQEIITARRAATIEQKKAELLKQKAEEAVAERDREIEKSKTKLIALSEELVELEQSLERRKRALQESENAFTSRIQEENELIAELENAPEEQLISRYLSKYTELVLLAEKRRDTAVASASHDIAEIKQAICIKQSSATKEEQSIEALKAESAQAVAELMAKRSALEGKLAQMGFFQFSAKKELKEQLSALNDQIDKETGNLEQSIQDVSIRVERLHTELESLAKRVQDNEAIIAESQKAFEEETRQIPIELRDQEFSALRERIKAIQTDWEQERAKAQTEQKELYLTVNAIKKQIEDEKKQPGIIEKAYSTKLSKIERDASSEIAQIISDTEKEIPLPEQPPLPLSELLSRALRADSWQTAAQIRRRLPKEYEDSQLTHLENALIGMVDDGRAERQISNGGKAQYKLST